MSNVQEILPRSGSALNLGNGVAMDKKFRSMEQFKREYFAHCECGHEKKLHETNHRGELGAGRCTKVGCDCWYWRELGEDA